MLLFSLSRVALAADDPNANALTTTIELAKAEPRARFEWRVQRPNRFQLGLSGQVGLAQGLYLNGWPVDAGRTFTGQLLGSFPLVHQQALRVDLQLESGPRFLWAAEPVENGQDGSLSLATGLRPLATLLLSNVWDLQLGWTARFDMQIRPNVSADAIGQLLLGGAVLHLSPNLDCSLRVETGGLYGYNGDGAKYLTRVGLGLRWFPGRNAQAFSNF